MAIYSGSKKLLRAFCKEWKTNLKVYRGVLNVTVISAQLHLAIIVAQADLVAQANSIW